MEWIWKNEDKKMTKQFYKILKNEGLKDWTIRGYDIGGAGLCIHKTKELLLAVEHYNLAFFLHEVAHAKTPGNKHNGIWADEYTRLIEYYISR